MTKAATALGEQGEKYNLKKFTMLVLEANFFCLPVRKRECNLPELDDDS